MKTLVAGSKTFCVSHIQFAHKEEGRILVVRPGRRDYVEGEDAITFFKALAQLDGFVQCNPATVIQTSHIQGVDEVGYICTILFDRAECSIPAKDNPLIPRKSTQPKSKKASTKKTVKKKATKKKTAKKSATKKKTTKKKS